MGAALRIKIVLAGALFLALAVGWLQLKSLEAGRAALLAREAEKARLAAQTGELRRELEDLYNNDAPCQTWADSLVPDPVYRRLRP